MKNKKFNLAGVTAETWARTAVLVLALINQILAIFGKGQIEIAESDIYQVFSIMATISSSIWSWWKNNSFTFSAQEGDNTMKELEKGTDDYIMPVENSNHHRELG